MRWKFILATFVGICIGAGAPIVLRSYILRGMGETRADYVRTSWPSTGKNWQEFAKWLRHGGRRLTLDGAFTAAKDGLSEDEVRAVFGPPDLVVVGGNELRNVPQANRSDAGGAYIYKIGAFAHPTNGQITSETFVIVIDRSGKVIYRLGAGVRDDERIADIESDTRSDRRIVPAN